MLVYMIRHGESENNAKRIHSGWAQIPLTQKGIEDAQKAKKTLDGVSFDRIYASDLLRARQTCATVYPDVEPTLVPALREIHVGGAQSRSRAECEALFGEPYIKGRAELDFRAIGGERWSDHLARVSDFLRSLEQESFGRVALFCHEGSIHCAYNFVKKTSEFEKIPVSNGGVCVFEYANGEWSLLNWDM